MTALLEVLGEVQLRLGRVAAAVETLDEAVYQAGRDDLVPPGDRTSPRSTWTGPPSMRPPAAPAG